MTCTMWEAGGYTYYHIWQVAAIPIGAYGAPSEVWFHRQNHMSPEEAVACRADLRARHALAIHWGTFQLTAEPLLEPAARLVAAREAAGLGEEEFVLLRHGESRCFQCEAVGPDGAPVPEGGG